MAAAGWTECLDSGGGGDVNAAGIIGENELGMGDDINEFQQ
jgi:hypothetical protein